MVLWDDVFQRAAADCPGVETESVLVDAMSAQFVLHPEDLSAVVASDLNADILCHLGSAPAGSLGPAAGANLTPERRFPSMFEPVHGFAPDIAGQGPGQPRRRGDRIRASPTRSSPATTYRAVSQPWSSALTGSSGSALFVTDGPAGFPPRKRAPRRRSTAAGSSRRAARHA
ncbi:isocitrate/isopropylmalate family dehydrogenase [Streptomyces sp. NPDC017936]|uniref:isocitrate/isopropylmalate family dehydrogenase n=1 Tax=Streptomyces sp. NPDC017936 TaxID=3365016 RepID=UPI0037B5C616